MLDFTSRKGGDITERFQVGPLSEEQFRSLETDLRLGIYFALTNREKKRDGIEVPRLKIGEMPSNLIPQEIDRQMKEVHSEILGAARTILGSDIFSFDSIQQRLGTTSNVSGIQENALKSATYDIAMAVMEALKNCAEHGNIDPRKRIEGDYAYHEAEKLFQVTMWDEGWGFSPSKLLDADVKSCKGRGIKLMLIHSDDCRFGFGNSTGAYGSSVELDFYLDEKRNRIKKGLEEIDQMRKKGFLRRLLGS